MEDTGPAVRNVGKRLRIGRPSPNTGVFPELVGPVMTSRRSKSGVITFSFFNACLWPGLILKLGKKSMGEAGTYFLSCSTSEAWVVKVSVLPLFFLFF
jgi:hypothetical protein